jgi:hypothetical protein
MARPRKVRNDSPAEMVRRLQREDGGIDPPPGVELETDELRQIWDQFTRARTPDAWRDLDLLLLVKAVRFEAKIRECDRLLEKSGLLLKSGRGTPIKNPLIEIQDGYLRQMLAVIRTMSLGTNGQDARTLNGNGALEEADARKLREMGAPRLLAL